MIGIEFTQGQAAAPLGSSKIGGRPHVPESFEWPGDLAFIAQINFAECKPFDTANLLPPDGIMYLFSTCDEAGVQEGDDGAYVVQTWAGPASGLTVADFPAGMDTVEGQLFERRMVFTATDQFAEARMLGAPEFFRPELKDAFDPDADTLLLALSGMRLWRGQDDRASIFGDGTFFVITGGGIEDAWVLFESGT